MHLEASAIMQFVGNDLSRPEQREEQESWESVQWSTAQRLWVLEIHTHTQNYQNCEL